ncbi:ADP-heptose--lipooligosaccharide heptosyltransferase II [hydrothermal vent metagenome]|uniref:ADP-heptose--lipooligosaccharide heptosyltransferase II n=1 Tax=hydrothermal vent metagenome TaxID=652676 RepID=A0A3B1BWF5_9ZZZZ
MTARKIDLGETPRILVARTDRIGDVALSLPVFASLRKAFPKAKICALTRNYTREILEGRDDVDEIISFDSESSRIPLRSFPGLVSKIKEMKFDVGIALYLNFSVSLLLALSRVPRRLGPATKAAQIFLTDKVKQRRSKGKRHEADHNLDLLKPLSVAPVRRAVIDVAEPRLITFKKNEGRPLIGVHPGHGGSSRNWPENHYAELISRLSSSGCDVVVTGSTIERELVRRVIKRSGVKPQVYLGNGGLKELACALAGLDVFIGPSTGPLHIASAVGTPVVGLYCPIFVCLPARWSPIGPNDTALTPDVEPCDRCVNEKCAHYDCMETISVEKVKEAALAKVRALADA